MKEIGKLVTAADKSKLFIGISISVAITLELPPGLFAVNPKSRKIGDANRRWLPRVRWTHFRKGFHFLAHSDGVRTCPSMNPAATRVISTEIRSVSDWDTSHVYLAGRRATYLNCGKAPSSWWLGQVFCLTFGDSSAASATFATFHLRKSGGEMAEQSPADLAEAA